MNCKSCGSRQMTTGVKPLSNRLLEWFHKCLACGTVEFIALRHDPRPEDVANAERRSELMNKIMGASL